MLRNTACAHDSNQTTSACEIGRHKILSNLIASLGREHDVKNFDRNARLMEGLSKRDNVLALIDEILDDPNLLASIASRSYRHVNHFDKIVLVEEQVRDGYRLTLHLWAPPYSAAEVLDELIHDHRFSFWSAILTGTLRSQEFVPDPNGTQFNNYRYSPDAHSEYNNYAYQGVVGLKVKDRMLEKSAEVYYLSYDTTHRVLIPEDTMTCTMVLRSPRARSYSNVYNTTFPSTDTSNVNRMFSPDELAERFTRLRDRMRADRRSDVAIFEAIDG